MIGKNLWKKVIQRCNSKERTIFGVDRRKVVPKDFLVHLERATKAKNENHVFQDTDDPECFKAAMDMASQVWTLLHSEAIKCFKN